MNEAAPLKVSCPICRSQTALVFGGLYDDRYGYPDLFDLHRCTSCGHMHLPAQFTPEDLGQLYTRYYPRGNFDIESFRAEEEKHGFFAWLCGEGAAAFRHVPRNVRVLDIGCGLGQTLAYHKNRGCEAFGMEADGNVQAIARRYGLNIRQGIFDGTQFDSAFFDYVTLDQVAEHVTDPHALLQGIARVLKPGGKVIITTPNPRSLGARLYGRRWLNWHTPYHLQFYTPRSLGLAARQAGLELLSAKTITASEWQFYQWEHLRTFPAHRERSSFWSDGTGKGSNLGRELAYRIKRLSLHRWISRLLDALGVGDNFVFVLQKP
jgi:SAM-dependent methyltransferase